ncbi:class II aldolase/adducin family protein [Actinacidiphila yeochonensis]|uniref:class II aldolase/adducin family protein n=1 Tax=Actinacidiphila yeochonensis TaxID=89050 RepID=UPI001E3AF07B|nr:class II aldolase/adducin family protein [Actinacidiphila yeochonensis]
MVDAARRTVADGLVVGTSGNVSARVGGLVLVTPTGVPYHRLGPDDAVGVELDTGRQVLGRLRPTSELPLHLAVYRSTGTRAVVHTHAPHATAASLLTEELPAVHYMAAELGGRPRTAGYALYGTPELAESVLAALRGGRGGCLMRNHGMLTLGAGIDHAYDRTAQLEWMCRVWLLARAAGDTPTLLDDAELAAAAERFRGYGQPAAPGTGTAPGTEAESGPGAATAP